ITRRRGGARRRGRARPLCGRRRKGGAPFKTWGKPSRLLLTAFRGETQEHRQECLCHKTREKPKSGRSEDRPLHWAWRGEEAVNYFFGAGLAFSSIRMPSIGLSD